MVNPILAARKSMQLNRTEFAAAARISYATLWNAEKGLTLAPHARLLQLFERLGYDPDDMRRQYDTWREEMGEAIVKAAGAPGSVSRPGR